MIKARLIIEILGKPEKHVQDSMDKVIESMKNDDLCTVDANETFPTKEKDGLFSIFSETDVTFKMMADMHDFCFKYMPSSIDILEPLEFKTNIADLTNATNDLLASIHNYDMMLKNSNSKLQATNKNMIQLLNNFVYHLLKKPMNIQGLAKGLGLSEEQCEPILDEMSEKGRIIKDGMLYKRK